MTLLHIPNVFSPSLCARLIALHGTTNRQSGFMWPNAEGKYAERIDPTLKQRTDHYVEDPEVVDEIKDALLPVLGAACDKGWMEVGPTFIERHLVARYDAPGGRFAEHVDNMFPGTRHRKVAVSVGLNDAFTMGTLVCETRRKPWPDYASFRRPVNGNAVVFPCDLRHEVLPVTSGSRFVYLTFLYDEAGEAIRQSELSQLSQEQIHG
jgi:predicted 2-oxoglutarate/Fe(II)-dependent dioxygenase YbiX